MRCIITLPLVSPFFLPLLQYQGPLDGVDMLRFLVMMNLSLFPESFASPGRLHYDTTTTTNSNTMVVLQARIWESG